MKVGIVGSTTDLHSEVVRWALEAAGVECRLFDTLGGFYQEAGVSLFAGMAGRPQDGVLDRELRALWYRRHYRLRSPQDVVPDENTAFRTSECDLLQDNIISGLSVDDRIGWINNPRNLALAESKFAQLLFARKAGLAIPATLMTSDPDQIRAFAREFDTVAVKPFGIYAWQYDNRRTRYATASKVRSGKIIDSADEALSNTPAIYQSAVDKVSDLRVVVLDDEVYAYDIRQSGEANFDSRFAMADASRTTITPHPLSQVQRHAVLAMMRLIGIEMASADFALTADNEIVFLDLNPAGAWLFLEHRAPQTSLTSRLCSLLARKAGLELERPFPTYDQFLSSGGMEAFKKLCAAKTKAGVTIMNDRTWRETEETIA